MQKHGGWANRGASRTWNGILRQGKTVCKAWLGWGVEGGVAGEFLAATFPLAHLRRTSKGAVSKHEVGCRDVTKERPARSGERWELLLPLRLK